LLVPSPLWIVAGADVPALRSDIATLGAERWLGGSWLASANAYRRRSSGYIVRDPAPGELFGRSLVVGSERASGVELSARKLTGPLTGAASYSYGVARTRAAGMEFPSGQERRHSADVTVLARLTPQVHAGAAYTFATGAPYTRVVSTLEQDPDGTWRPTPGRAEEPNARRMRAHESLDLLLEWFFGRRWSAFFQVRNVLDRENPLIFMWYEECPAERPPGFYRCGDDQFNAGVRRFPALGVRATF
jgi:outer membrane cobalamin receptor